jgi:hypothetical protein
MRHTGWGFAIMAVVAGCSSSAPLTAPADTIDASVSSTSRAPSTSTTAEPSTSTTVSSTSTTTIVSATTTIVAETTTTTDDKVDDGVQHLHDCVVITLGFLGFTVGSLAAVAGPLDPQTVNDSALYVAAFADEPLDVPDDIRQFLLQAGAASQTSIHGMNAATTDDQRKQVVAQLGADLAPIGNALNDYFDATCSGPLASAACKNSNTDSSPLVFTQPEHTEAYYTELFELTAGIAIAIPGCAAAFIAPDGSREDPASTDPPAVDDGYYEVCPDVTDFNPAGDDAVNVQKHGPDCEYVDQLILDLGAQRDWRNDTHSLDVIDGVSCVVIAESVNDRHGPWWGCEGAGYSINFDIRAA